MQPGQFGLQDRLVRAAVQRLAEIDLVVEHLLLEMRQHHGQQSPPEREPARCGKCPVAVVIAVQSQPDLLQMVGA
jgi:hypothetical protein